MNKSVMRAMVRGAYDLQKLRIQSGLRVVAAFKTKIGQMPGHGEDELEEVAAQILKELRSEYERITDAITQNGKVRKVKESDFNGYKLLSDASEFTLVKEYLALLNAEESQFKDIGRTLKSYPVWTSFLDGVRGVGPAMAGVIISEIDISKAMYPSSLHKYAGLDVAPNDDGVMAGRSRKSAHLVDVTYTTKDGKEDVRKGITFNPFLKTKLIGVLGSSFIKLGGPYRDIYDGYKNRLQNRPDLTEESKGHIHNMAVRYMIKMFLIDLHREWRKLEGYAPTEPYHVAKLHLRDHAA
ncbi:MAG: TIGR-Tas system RNA-guided endonuclease [Candidatus Aquicultor sp.]